MSEGKFDREFLRGALALTSRSDVDRLLLVSDQPVSPNELRGRPIKKKLVYAVTTDVIVGFRWPYVTGPDTEPLQTKIDSLRRFADTVITKAKA